MKDYRIAEPFWKSGTMLYEPVMLYQMQDGPASGALRYIPKRILSVQNSALDREYVEGVDYTIAEKTITRLEGSEIPCMTDDVYWARKAEKGLSTQLAADKVGRVLYADSPYITQHQIAVTYEFDPAQSHMKETPYREGRLQRTVDRLLNRQPVRVVLYGDSIAFGANASGMMDIEPFMPNWGELLRLELEKRYGACVELHNTAVSGMNSTWGVENVKERVCAYEPDLTILAFGMNDGSQMLPPEDFARNTRRMIEQIGTGDYILVAPILANPDSEFVGNQELYQDALRELEAPHIVTVDMTAAHQELLKGKRYIDFSGNNINHPNDFLIRCYASLLLRPLLVY